MERLLNWMKPESIVMLLLFFIIVGLGGIIAWDSWKKWQIDKDIKSLKTIFIEVASYLPHNGLDLPMTISEDYLSAVLPQIAEITFYPNQQIYVQYQNIAEERGTSLLFTFHSLEELSLGKVRCVETSLPFRKTPSQCR